MDITDLPDKIRAALKFSLKSPGKFLLSVIFAVVVLGVAYDLVYVFFYTRIYDTEHAHYGTWFWFGLLFFAVVLPLALANIGLIRARRKFRAFPQGKFGIAIVPFEVASIDPDVLGTPAKLASLDEIMRQYFDAAKRACDAEQWLDNFEVRFLPTHVRFKRKQDALDLRRSMDATLLIWGDIRQEQNKRLRMTQYILGDEVDIRMEGDVDLSRAGTFLAFYALCSAGFRLGNASHHAEAAAMFALARRGPASALDKISNDSHEPHHFVKMIDGFIQRYGGGTRSP